MRTIHLLAVWALLLSGCASENPRPRTETPRGGTVPMPPVVVPPFQGREAFRFLTAQTDFGPRNPGSTGHDRCLEYLEQTLLPLADAVRLQPFTHAGYDGNTLQLTNIIASFRPESTARILLCAHWDTRPRADRDPDPKRRDEPITGANDGASGVAVLLQIATLLKSNPPAVGVDIVLFDGEDYGTEGDTGNYLLGSRHFARTTPRTPAPRFGILLDMVGDADLELPRERFSVRYAPDVVNLVWETARALGVTEFVDYLGPEIIDDHLPLNEAGIRTVNIIDFQYPDATHRYWHTHGDTPDKCSPESLEAVGTVVAHVVYNQRP
ncbi:MAG: Peptidase family [Bacteroidetes bacterium]|nr:Peptidase family [Bacteroidota bacterium]